MVSTLHMVPILPSDFIHPSVTDSSDFSAQQAFFMSRDLPYFINSISSTKLKTDWSQRMLSSQHKHVLRIPEWSRCPLSLGGLHLHFNHFTPVGYSKLQAHIPTIFSWKLTNFLAIFPCLLNIDLIFQHFTILLGYLNIHGVYTYLRTVAFLGLW
jgi:hypothetical protein